MGYDIVRTKSIVSAINCQTSPPTQYIFVTLNASGQLVAPSVHGNAAGVLQDTPAIGDPGAVCYPGDITKVMVGAGGVTAGQYVASDAYGCAVAAVSGSAFLGQVLTTTAQGSLAEMVFQPVGGVTP